MRHPYCPALPHGFGYCEGVPTPVSTPQAIYNSKAADLYFQRAVKITQLLSGNNNCTNDTKTEHLKKSGDISTKFLHKSDGEG